MGFAGPLLSVVQTGIGLMGNEQETQAKQKEAVENTRLAQRAAVDALERGNRESGQARMATSQLIAKQQLAYANSGVDSTVGTPAQVASDTRTLGEMDARQLENNAAREAWGFRTYGSRYREQAQLEATRGTNRAYGTALAGAGRFVGSFGGSGVS